VYPLIVRYPELKAKLPYLQLTELPTPISRADRLGAGLGLDSLMIKRDDESALLYGGNKVRKLEFVLADALDKGCDAVVTFGAVGSNHALATAIYATQLGLKVYVVLTDQPVTPNIANTLRYHATLGTTLVHAGSYENTVAAYEHIIANHPTGAERVYKVAWGGSSWLGTTGFVAAAMELADQIPTGAAPDVIYAACGTMGTAAGLSLGCRLAGLSARIQAVQVTPPAVYSENSFQKLFNATNAALHERDTALPLLENPMLNVDTYTDFYGDGYAIATPQACEAVELISETEGLKLETTYTGKALAALLEHARTGKLSGKKVLFWNTYNSRAYPDEITRVSTKQLPESLQKYL
jgi:1-aminocyclopropane-1-carboxylate deaminase/D-cysteine desulfhydrase-like pyridoxal-dependent ACC family enzyme